MNLYKGQIIKNYKELCVVMNWNVTTGTAKMAQIKEFERYCTYERQGNKFIIIEVFKTPVDKVDNRVNNGNTGKYRDSLNVIVLDIAHNNTKTYEYFELFEPIGLCDYNKIILSNNDTKDIRRYKNKFKNNLKVKVKSTCDYLQKIITGFSYAETFITECGNTDYATTQNIFSIQKQARIKICKIYKLEKFNSIFGYSVSPSFTDAVLSKYTNMWKSEVNEIYGYHQCTEGLELSYIDTEYVAEKDKINEAKMQFKKNIKELQEKSVLGRITFKDKKALINFHNEIFAD